MAYSILADATAQCNGALLRNIATDFQRTLATVEFVESQCIIPSSVDMDEVFDLKIVYRLATIEKRNYNGILDHFDPGVFDGGFYKTYYDMVVPYMAWWTWHFSQLQFWVQKGIGSPGWELTHNIGRALMNPPQTFTWTFRGTISDLLGQTPLEEGPVEVAFALSGTNTGWHDPADYWPYDYVMQNNWFGPCEGMVVLKKSVAVSFTPTQPYPLFVPDGCSVSKESVQPNETFTVKTTIVNQNQYSGQYSIDIICLGHTTNLAAGTIAGNQTLIKSKNFTMNQLAGQEITDDRMIDIVATVSNIEGEKDRLPPWQIAVFVTPGQDVGNIAGIVKDITTNLPLSGVSVSTVGRTVITNSSGYYTFNALVVGRYSVEFAKTGYWPTTKEVNVTADLTTTLNVSLTPTTEPPPAEGEIPWKWVGIGVLGVAGVALIGKGLREKKVAKRKE